MLCLVTRGYQLKFDESAFDCIFNCLTFKHSHSVHMVLLGAVMTLNVHFLIKGHTVKNLTKVVPSKSYKCGLL